MSTISKTEYTFTVLHPTDQPPLGLADALQESDTGRMVGNITREETFDVPDDVVSNELLDLGNDGTFFDDELGLED